MTTLVTGAAGFLGSHVARQLVAQGDDVRVLLRASSSNRAISDLSLEYVTGDLRDPRSLERAMAGAKRVFHVAADYRLWAKRSQDIYDSNVGGTKNLLAAARKAGVERLIYTSTVATVASRKAPTNSVKTDVQVAAPPIAPRTTAASSAIDLRRRCNSCSVSAARSSTAAVPPITFEISSTLSATRASQVENTLRRRDRKNTGVRPPRLREQRSRAMRQH